MANPNFKGRQRGSIKKTSLIIDPALGDYKILFDEDGYTLIYIEPITNKEKIIGYYTQLISALKKLVKLKALEKQPVYTLKDYIQELETTLNNLKNLINE